MASKVEIVNIALTKLGIRTITAMTEASEPARRATVLFDITRKTVLRDHDWSFARKLTPLALSGSDTVLGWDFIYVYPSDCEAARKLVTEGSGSIFWDYDSESVSTALRARPFEVFLSGLGSYKLIATNLEDAYLCYTSNVTDASLFDAGFVDAFSYRLAADLAQSQTGDSKKGTEMMQLYRGSLALAQAHNQSEKYVLPTDFGNNYYNVR